MVIISVNFWSGNTISFWAFYFSANTFSLSFRFRIPIRKPYNSFLITYSEKCAEDNSLNLLNRRKFRIERELGKQKEGITKDKYTG